MSEEEKEAIKIVEDIAFVRGIRQDVEGELKDLGAIEDVLRLIDKLQKENEELKKQVDIEFVEENYIEKSKVVSKDKILKILNEDNALNEEQVLDRISLLWEEFNRLEDVEDRKVQIEYNNVFNKGVRSVEQKIRNKIKELEKRNNHSVVKMELLEEVLQELLEEE